MSYRPSIQGGTCRSVILPPSSVPWFLIVRALDDLVLGSRTALISSESVKFPLGMASRWCRRSNAVFGGGVVCFFVRIVAQYSAGTRPELLRGLSGGSSGEGIDDETSWRGCRFPMS